MLVEEITINGRTIEMQHIDVQLDQIELDEENPRIRYRLSLDESGKSLEDLLLDSREVAELKKDIKRTGGLRERVYLQQIRKGRYVVREGNCRYSCYSSLRKEEPRSTLWKRIPARILPPDVTDREVATLLSDWHVKGKIRWDAHEKAGYVHRMHVHLGMSLDEIAKCMRSSKSTIQRMKDAYELMVDVFLKIDKGKYSKMGLQKWSYFDEFYKKKELKEAAGADPEFGGKFARWVGEGRLPMAGDVRRLAKVVGNPKAREAFESGAKIDKAFAFIEAEDPEEGSQFFALLAKVRTACRSAASLKDVIRVREDEVAQQRLLDTHNALREFMELADLDPRDAPRPRKTTKRRTKRPVRRTK